MGTETLLGHGGNEEKTGRWTQGQKAGIPWSGLSDRETTAFLKYSMDSHESSLQSENTLGRKLR